MNQLCTIEIIALNWSEPIGIGFFNGQDYIQLLKRSNNHDLVWEFLQVLKEVPGRKARKGKKKEWVIYSHGSEAHVNKIILKSLLDHNQTIEPAPGVGMVKWVNENITFRDAHAMLPMSIVYLQKAFGLTSDPVPEPTAEVSSCGPVLQKFCVALHHVVTAYIEQLDKHYHISPSMTLAVTAVKAFDKGFYPVDNIRRNADFECFIRKATYGGRNEIYQRYGENLNDYDVISMYPSCYDVPVPIGVLKWITPDIDKGTIAEAKVKVPKDSYLGPLPTTLFGQLIFPVGEFQGWWDMRELRNAVDNFNVDVTILRQAECKEEPILKEFGEYGLMLKETYKSQGKIWKQFNNLLYGKFGERGGYPEIRDIRQLVWEDLEGCTPLSGTNELFWYVPPKKRPHKYKKTAISMRIRAEARIRHLNFLQEALETGELFYCDTDSVLTTAQMETGTKPGELKLVRSVWRGYFIKQKFYGMALTGGGFVARTSGYSGPSLREEDFLTLLNNGEIELEQYRNPSMKGILAYAPMERRKTMGTIVNPSSRNRWVGGSQTFPIELPLPGKLSKPIMAFLKEIGVA